MAKLVQKIYGDALFELAVESNQMNEMLQESKDILVVLHKNNELLKLMQHPQITKEEKQQFVETIFKEKVHKEFIGIMCILISNEHYDKVESVFTYFMEQVKEYKKIGTAYVTVPVMLTESQKEQLKVKLLQTTHYVEFEMYYKVDKSLLGGAIIRIGDCVVDNSVKNKLQQMTRALLKIQLKVGECTL